MKFLARSKREKPRVSLVLLDWSVRESFHLLHYLAQQTAARDDFEIIIVEYYARVSPALAPFANDVDTWLLLEMPDDVYYHKHLMYNAGIALARGEIVVIGDSDMIVKPSFIETIIRAFDAEKDLVYHIDQFRNIRRDFYPFNFPRFEEVLGEGCINNTNGRTSGVADQTDPIHTRNYGASMCARRADLIAIGGADMHIDYLGHICGPYDLTFRLINAGKQERWDEREFTAHTWHPGQAGVDNYMGPHDGRHMSSTALVALSTGRIMPYVENEAIEQLRGGNVADGERALEHLIPARARHDWRLDYVAQNAARLRLAEKESPLGVYAGFRLIAKDNSIRALRVGADEEVLAFCRTTEGEAKHAIDASLGLKRSVLGAAARACAVATAALRHFYALATQRLPGPLPGPLKGLLSLLLAPVVLFYLIVFDRRRLDDLEKNAAGKLSLAAREGEHLALALSMLPSEIASEHNLFLCDDLETRIVARMTRWLGAARFRLQRVRNLADADAALKAFRNAGPSGAVLVPSALYQRLHETIAPHRGALRLIVI